MGPNKREARCLEERKEERKGERQHHSAIAALKGPWQFWRFLGALKPKNAPMVL
jgi:hypothetical protein